MSDADTITALDATLARTWQARKLQPAREADELTFLRRATLDIAGRIPTLREVHDFQHADKSTRRSDLIDRLNASAEAWEYWARLWTDWLLMPTGPRQLRVFERRSTRPGEVFVEPEPLPHVVYQEQLQLWLEEQFSENRGWDRIAADLLTATGLNSEKHATVFLLLHLGEEERDPNRAKLRGQFDALPATRQTLRIFLGIRSDGLPEQDVSISGELTARQFWGVNAFFRQVARVGSPDPRGLAPVQLTLSDNPTLNERCFIEYTTEKGEKAKAVPKFIDGRKIPEDNNRTRREVLARYVVSHKQFARAYVSRIWAHFFGRGFHERPDCDDLGKHHTVLHPELLDRLAADFVKTDYDHRRLVSWICRSRAYALDTRIPDPLRKDESERYFAHMALKPMNPSQLESSLVTALAIDPKRGAGRVRILVMRKAIRRNWIEGQPHREPLSPALWLMNDFDLSELMAERADLAVKRGDGDRAAWIDELFLAVLGREPTAEQKRKLKEDFKVFRPQRKEPKETDLAEDLLWALLQSCEFIINH
jgi:hypothetical protein